MPLPTATKEKGKTDWGATAETLEDLDDGSIRGKRWYRIEGRQEVRSMQAIGLPRQRELWEGFRDLRVVKRRFFDIGGVFDTTAQYGGWCGCEIDYATPSLSGRAVPELNKSYAEWQSAHETITRNYDVRVNPPAGFDIILPPGVPITPIAPINNGKGVQISVGTIRVLVHKWMQGNGINPLLPRILELHRFQLLNSDAVTVPPEINDTQTYTFQRGQLQYMEFHRQPDGEFIKVTHVLAASPDFFYRWQPEDEHGDAAGEIVTNVVQLGKPFAGLW